MRRCRPLSFGDILALLVLLLVLRRQSPGRCLLDMQHGITYDTLHVLTRLCIMIVTIAPGLLLQGIGSGVRARCLPCPPCCRE